MKNIDTAFRYIRAFSLLLLIACAAITCSAIYSSQKLIKEMQSRIYVLAEGKIFRAAASSRQENLAVEMRSHVENFHELFFTLDPDEKVIQSQMAKALYLADGSAKQQYDHLRESGYIISLISGNISQDIAVDSVQIRQEQYPYPFSCYARQTIIRSSSRTQRRLVTSGYLREVARSENNPHGFLIERWKIENNQPNR